MADTIEHQLQQQENKETPLQQGSSLAPPNRSPKSQRLPPSAYREVGTSSSPSNGGRVSPALQRARMAVERGREFRTKAAEAVASDANACQSDDELTLMSRANELQALPKRPASALAGRVETPGLTAQPQHQAPTHQSTAQPSKVAEPVDATLRQQQQRNHQASLDDLFAKYPSMKASFKLLPPNKQQEQWSRLFELLESQQAAMVARQSAQHRDELEQLRSKVRRELSEERLLLGRRLANHSRLTNEAAGCTSVSARQANYEARSTRMIVNRIESPTRPNVQCQRSEQPTRQQSSQCLTSESPLRSKNWPGTFQIPGDSLKIAEKIQRLREEQQQHLEQQTSDQRYDNNQRRSNVDNDSEWRSVQLHGQLSELAKQLSETRRENDWLRSRLAEATGRVDELLTENFRLKAKLGGDFEHRSRMRSDSSSPRHCSPVRSGDGSWPANHRAMEATVKHDVTVAALRQSLADLERRNLIDRSPTRDRSRSRKEKSTGKPKSRSPQTLSRRQQQREPTTPSTTTRRSGKVRSSGSYIVIKS